MTRHMVALAALTAAVMLPARPAAAHGEGQGPIAVTGGWMWNVGDTPRNSQLVVGAQFATPQGGYGPCQWVLSADWIRLESDAVPAVAGTRRKSNFVPVLLSMKHHPGGGPFYLMAGAGGAWSQRDVPEMGITSRIGFAWQGGVGYGVGRWFVEGRYLAGPHPSRDAMYGAQLGISF